MKKQESPLVAHAKRELGILTKDKNDEMQRYMNQNIIDIITMFSNQRHSEFSASYAINILEKLMRYENLTEITGAEDEWDEGSDYDGLLIQHNNRNSKIFRKNRDNSTAKIIDAKIFTDDGGSSWFTNKHSFVPIKFPFKSIEVKRYNVDDEGNIISEYIDGDK